jgi:hypothetical protein
MIYIYLMGTFNTFIHKTFLIASRIVLNISCCVLDRGGIVLMFKYMSASLHTSSVKVAIVFVRLAIMSDIKLSWLSSSRINKNFYEFL